MTPIAPDQRPHLLQSAPIRSGSRLGRVSVSGSPSGALPAFLLSGTLHIALIATAVGAILAGSSGDQGSTSQSLIAVSDEVWFAPPPEEREIEEEAEPTEEPRPAVEPPLPLPDWPEEEPLENELPAEASSRREQPAPRADLLLIAARPFTGFVAAGVLVAPRRPEQAEKTAEARPVRPVIAAKPAPSRLPPAAPKASLSPARPVAPSWSYPRRARDRGLEGTVVVEVVVGLDGRASNGRVVTSSGHGLLDRAALRAVLGWRFEPARRGEEAIVSRHRQPLSYTLR